MLAECDPCFIEDVCMPSIKYLIEVSVVGLVVCQHSLHLIDFEVVGTVPYGLLFKRTSAPFWRKCWDTSERRLDSSDTVETGVGRAVFESRV